MMGKTQNDQPLDVTPKPYFDAASWKENHFHEIEVQACGETETIQFAWVDSSGDCPSQTLPGPVALPLEQAGEMARWILAQIETIRGKKL